MVTCELHMIGGTKEEAGGRIRSDTARINWFEWN